MASKRKGKGRGKGGKYRTAATLTVHGMGAMSARGRRDIVEWLRKQAADFARHGDDYTEGRFRHSFRYT